MSNDDAREIDPEVIVAIAAYLLRSNSAGGGPYGRISATSAASRKPAGKRLRAPDSPAHRLPPKRSV